MPKKPKEEGTVEATTPVFSKFGCPKCGYPHAAAPKCRNCGEPISEL